MERNVTLTSRVSHTGVVEFFEHIKSAANRKMLPILYIHLLLPSTLSNARDFDK